MARILLLIPTATYRAGAFVSAARRSALDITIASEERSSLGDLVPDDLIELDLARPEAAAEIVSRFATTHDIRAVIAVDDQATLSAAAIAARLGLAHNSPTSVYATRNKYEMRRRLSAGGVAQPDYRLATPDANAHAIGRELGFPCVVKPLMMAASRGVVRVDDETALAEALARTGAIVRAPDAPDDPQARSHVLVERYVPGWEVALEGILTGGDLHTFAIFDKPDPLEGPYFPETIYVTPSRLSPTTQERIVALTQQATRAIGLEHGPVHAEVRGTDDKMWFIEVAARSIGGYCSKVLRFAGESTLEDVIVAHALDPAAALPAVEPASAGVLMLQATRAGRVESIDGVEAAAAGRHIDEVILSTHIGQEVTPLPEGFLYLGFVFARAPSPQETEAALRQAGELLSVNVASD